MDVCTFLIQWTIKLQNYFAYVDISSVFYFFLNNLPLKIKPTSET